MSDHIPFHIQVEIFKWLPIKSLLRSRSVSKAWKSFIDSSEFIAAHSVRHTHSHHLLLGYQDPGETKQNYVSFVDDHTFPQQRFDLTIPLFVGLLREPKVIGSSHGLLCLYGDQSCLIRGTDMAVVWNPSIRKSVAISIPHMLSDSYYNVLGFGICLHTNDPKVVKINCTKWGREDITSIPWQVEVFTLSSWGWRSLCSNLPRKSIAFKWSQTTIDGFIYWLAIDRIILSEYYLIMSFDLTSEEFREVDLPVSLAHLARKREESLSIFKLRESLAVLEHSIEADKHVCSVWVMEHPYGVPNSFTKLFTIKAPGDLTMDFMGFRNNGKAIIKLREDSVYVDVPGTLVVFEPYSGSFSDLGIYGEQITLSVNSYMETLLLLNQPHGTLYFHHG